MRSEPQNIGLALYVFTSKLSCLIRSGHLIFQTNVVQRVNSGRIRLVHGDMYGWLYMLPSENSGKKLKFLREVINLKQI